MVVVWSIAHVDLDRLREWRPSNCGSSARMRSTVSMMFAPGSRKMMTITDGLPLT